MKRKLSLKFKTKAAFFFGGGEVGGVGGRSLFSCVIPKMKSKILINICGSKTNHTPLKPKPPINICGSETNHTPHLYDRCICRGNLISRGHGDWNFLLLQVHTFDLPLQHSRSMHANPFSQLCSHLSQWRIPTESNEGIMKPSHLSKLHARSSQTYRLSKNWVCR